MHVTRSILIWLFVAACGTRATPPPSGPDPARASATTRSDEVRARCAELDGASDQAREAARVLATVTDHVGEAVTCLGRALERTTGPYVGGTEQRIDREQLRVALAGAIQSLAGIGKDVNLDRDADLQALANEAKQWGASH